MRLVIVRDHSGAVLGASALNDDDAEAHVEALTHVLDESVDTFYIDDWTNDPVESVLALVKQEYGPDA